MRRIYSFGTIIGTRQRRSWIPKGIIGNIVHSKISHCRDAAVQTLFKQETPAVVWYFRGCVSFIHSPPLGAQTSQQPSKQPAHFESNTLNRSLLHLHVELCTRCCFSFALIHLDMHQYLNVYAQVSRRLFIFTGKGLAEKSRARTCGNLTNSGT